MSVKQETRKLSNKDSRWKLLGMNSLTAERTARLWKPKFHGSHPFGWEQDVFWKEGLKQLAALFWVVTTSSNQPTIKLPGCQGSGHEIGVGGRVLICSFCILIVSVHQYCRNKMITQGWSGIQHFHQISNLGKQDGWVVTR